MRRIRLSVCLLLLLTSSAFAQTEVNLDTIRAGRYDSGKMWTFEYAPSKYFSETYSFNADQKWFERARLAAVKIPGCSASFVSPNGLIVTNHHCARNYILQVAKPGERLDDTGFFAKTLAEERRVAGFTADQLIAIHDVSAEVFAATDRVADAERAATRAAVINRIETRYKQEHARAGTDVVVNVVALYAGGRYSAYVYRRYSDVRLVAAPELQLGFFGGDADNFTYPRYDLDFTFLRVYGPDGKPINSTNYFTWSRRGIEENDVVFVIGNPGPTTRMNAVAQIEFIRDIQLPATLASQQRQWDSLNVIYTQNPDAPDAPAIRNRMFSLSNRLKAGYGRIAALNDPAIIARRRDAERRFMDTVSAHAAINRRFGTVLSRLADIQQRKRQFVTQHSAAVVFGDTSQMSVEAQRDWRSLLAEEAEWNAQLGRARFEIYGTEFPPDATSSPRITDGVVLRYDYNGTVAPPYTTFFGMYDRYYAFGPGTEWDLPKRWVPKPRDLDLATPLNFVSTADTYGGNSGSPAVTKNLELVGLNFDRNINGLVRDYLYLPERGRNVMVDVRAIAESLETVYNAPHILQELFTGRLPR